MAVHHALMRAVRFRENNKPYKSFVLWDDPREIGGRFLATFCGENITYIYVEVMSAKQLINP